MFGFQKMYITAFYKVIKLDYHLMMSQLNGTAAGLIPARGNMIFYFFHFGTYRDEAMGLMGKDLPYNTQCLQS